MKLIAAPASPFVRKVRVTLLETGQWDDVEQVDVKTSPLASDPAVLAANPVGKIPALTRPDGPSIHDSRVICRFLDARARAGLYPDNRIWDVLTLEATADGIMDSAVLVTYETRLRAPEQQNEAWREAQWAKVDRALSALNTRWMSHLYGPLDMGQIAVACALGYLDFRHDARNWRKGNDALAAWFAEFSARDSMTATAPKDL
ncbi:Glutathione S-transferase [Salinihabitans flavidus]|uniref:Glutathione S-transferase n=1 Tax=Salinihabitans flavidus TaxID=569882 RepID=A0A1H8S1Q3_9RHOB|nr:glutathione S-transferase [Salinihabitans flavidus]SEO72374.1 Glutathione S-transferase [Salinihabitans flavidus]